MIIRGKIGIHLKLILFFCLVLFVKSCSTNTCVDEPLKGVLNRLEEALGDDYTLRFKNAKEKDVIPIYYNKLSELLSLYADEDECAKAFFERYEWHPEDGFTHVILLAWHRKLNYKPLSLEEEMEEISNRYNTSDSEVFGVEKRTKIADDNYAKYNVGDTLEIAFPIIIFKDNQKNAFYFGAFSEDKEKELLLIRGIVVNKYEKYSNLFLDIRIMYMSDYNIPFLFRSCYYGDVITVNLDKYLKRI